MRTALWNSKAYTMDADTIGDCVQNGKCFHVWVQQTIRPLVVKWFPNGVIIIIFTRIISYYCAIERSGFVVHNESKAIREITYTDKRLKNNWTVKI